MIRVPRHREPNHPGEMLLEEFLKPMDLSKRDVANGIRVPYQRVNELVNGRRGITPATALRLAKQRWDLYHAQQSEAPALRTIRKTKRAD